MENMSSGTKQGGQVKAECTCPVVKTCTPEQEKSGYTAVSVPNKARKG